MNHALVTIAIPFPTDRAAAVQRVLDELGNPADVGPRAKLDAAGLVHFMSLSVVADTAPGLAHFFLELSADGGPEDAVSAVYIAIGDTIDRAFEVAGLNLKSEPTVTFLRRYELLLGPQWGRNLGVGFAGAPLFSVTRIRNEARLADEITESMQDVLRSPHLSAMQKLEAVRQRVWALDEKWAFFAEPAPFLDHGKPLTIPARAFSALKGLLKLCWPLIPIPFLLWWWLGFWQALAVSLVLVVAAAALAVATLRRLETTDPVDDTTPNAAKIEEMLLHENTGAQNLLACVSVMKAGWFRRLILRIGFAAAVEDIATLFRPGFLREIGVIHFARWALIPGTDKLMFWSNFSDGWESYLEDFIQKAGDGLTAIWSNTRGFPRTWFLLGGGAADGDRFRRWARRQQYVASFWYSAYPALKMNRIRRNAAIRQGLAAARTTAEAEDWINCFGSEPRPAFMLHKAEIPTLALGGLKRMRFSTALILRLPQDVDAARAWLSEVAPAVTFGEAGRDERAASIAFTANGLTRLGLADTDLANFPAAFQNGITSPGRSRALGDLGPHAPENWLWGRADQTDAVLVLFETSADRLAASQTLMVDGLKAHGGEAVFIQPMKDRPVDTSAQVFEPFGFADGISQPILQDSPRARIADNAEHIVAPGEFLLGYPDNRGYFPPTPTVPAGADPRAFLAESGAGTLGVAASFEGGGSDGTRDFGLNGTFMVVRQLEQDVPAFHHFTASEAHRLSKQPNGPFLEQEVGALQNVLEAKMLGRWKSGRSLVRNAHPDAPGPPDNGFTFQREDPQGFSCPLGAHIRRANPRDSIDTNSATQMALSNRHRILRVGRPYEAPKGGLPGLLFICLNADIERQFEFLQRTWVLGSTFHHLDDEIDPLIGHNSGVGIFTIPTRQGPTQMQGLPDFVRVRGGGYFFMPGRRTLMYLASARTDAARAQAAQQPVRQAVFAKQ